MSKVLTFSQRFPKYHPDYNKETFFVQKFLLSIYVNYHHELYRQILHELNEKNIQLEKIKPVEIDLFFESLSNKDIKSIHPKIQTIRKGNRFKSGDRFSPRIWHNKPYRSPQIILWNPIHVYSTSFFNPNMMKNNKGLPRFYTGAKSFSENAIQLAHNDGFDSYEQFAAWFNEPFEGQIIW